MGRGGAATRRQDGQVHVARLHKALDDPDVLVTTPAGYCLRVRPDELDATHFERLVAGHSHSEPAQVLDAVAARTPEPVTGEETPA